MNVLESITGTVVAVSRSGGYTFSKENQESITLLSGLGVEGDAHMGETVKHRSRVARDPSQPNLRQVHLVHSELFDELRERDFDIQSGDIGENITTRGITLLDLPVHTLLHIGKIAVVQVMGLRNPCTQLNTFREGLMAAVLDRDKDGNLIRKAGIMGIVHTGGEVRLGDLIRVELPPLPYKPLEPV